jgi:hypothetical protein
MKVARRARGRRPQTFAQHAPIVPSMAMPPAAAPYRASGFVPCEFFGPSTMFELSP